MTQNKPKLMENVKKDGSKNIIENVSHGTIDPANIPIEQYAGLLMEGIDETKNMFQSLLKICKTKVK